MRADFGITDDSDATPGDEAGLRRLGVNMTSNSLFSTKNLFVSYSLFNLL